MLARRGELVTIGIEPTHPQRDSATSASARPLRGPDGAPSAPSRVRREARRRDLPRATSRPVPTGGTQACSSWGRRRCSTCSPMNHAEMVDHLRAIAADPSPDRAICGPRCTKIAIDHAVAEPAAAAGRVVVVPRPRWDDVGDFAALHDARRRVDRPAGHHPSSAAPRHPRSSTRRASSSPVVGAASRSSALDDLVVVDAQPCSSRRPARPTSSGGSTTLKESGAPTSLSGSGQAASRLPVGQRRPVPRPVTAASRTVIDRRGPRGESSPPGSCAHVGEGRDLDDPARQPHRSAPSSPRPNADRAAPPHADRGRPRRHGQPASEGRDPDDEPSRRCSVDRKANRVPRPGIGPAPGASPGPPETRADRRGR